MKKLNLLKLLLVLFVISNACIISAQDSSKDDKPAKIGIRAGWHYAGMFADGEILNNTEHINSFYIGVFKEKKIVPLLRFGSGLEYFMNGYELSDNSRREMHTLSIPLYLKLKVGPVYATGGTGLNFKVSENLPGSALLDPLNNEGSKTFDMPLQLGVGLKILMFSVEARYNWGLLDVNQEASNQYAQVGFTLSF